MCYHHGQLWFDHAVNTVRNCIKYDLESSWSEAGTVIHKKPSPAGPLLPLPRDQNIQVGSHTTLSWSSGQELLANVEEVLSIKGGSQGARIFGYVTKHIKKTGGFIIFIVIDLSFIQDVYWVLMFWALL